MKWNFFDFFNGKREANKAVYALVLAALLAGCSGFLIKQMNSMSIGAIAWFRAAVPLLVLCPTIFNTTRPLFSGRYPKMLFTSLLNALRLYGYLAAFIFTTIGNAVVVFYSYPLFVWVFEKWVYRKPRSKYGLGFSLLAFLGLVLTYSDSAFSLNSNDFMGITAALLSAIGYAITVILFKSESDYYSKEQIIVYQNLASVVLFIPFLGAFASFELAHVGIALGYALLVGIGVFKLFFFGLKRLQATTASALMYLEVVSAIFIGHFLLGEKFTLNAGIGGGLILLSSFLITKRQQDKFTS